MATGMKGGEAENTHSSEGRIALRALAGCTAPGMSWPYAQFK